MNEREQDGELDPMITEAAKSFDARQAASRENETVRTRVENPLLDRCNELRRMFARVRGLDHETIARSSQLQGVEQDIEGRIVKITRKTAELRQRETETHNLDRASRMLPGSADYEKVPQMKAEVAGVQSQIESIQVEIEAEQEEIEKQIIEFEVAIKAEAKKKKE